MRQTLERQAAVRLTGSASRRRECRQNVFGRRSNDQIDEIGGGCLVRVDFDRESAAAGSLMNEPGGRMDERGCADREEQVAVAGRQRAVDVRRIQRFTEPDNRRTRQASTTRTPRTVMNMIRRRSARLTGVGRP